MDKEQKKLITKLFVLRNVATYLTDTDDQIEVLKELIEDIKAEVNLQIR